MPKSLMDEALPTVCCNVEIVDVKLLLEALNIEAKF